MDTQKGVKYFNILIHFSFTYAVLQSAHPASSMDGKPWSSCSSSAPGSWSRNRGWLPGHGSHTWPSRALVRRQRGCKMTLPRKYMEKNCRSGLDVTSSTDSMTSTHDFHALMCIYRHSNMFTLSLSLSADNSAIPCCPCCQTTSNLPCKKQRAHGDFVKANKHQQLLGCVECAALKAWDNDTIWLVTTACICTLPETRNSHSLRK